MTNNKISIIFPSSNEEDAICYMIDEITTVMKRNRYDFEVIVVDDGSTD